MTRALITTLVLAVAFAAHAQQESDLEKDFPKSSLVIQADRYGCYFFDIYLAESFPLQRRGLMHVREMPRTTGMLFIYEQPGIRSMWMKNTYISLDMLFVRRDGTVESVVAGTEPLSLKSISSGEPVNYVLELNAGVTDALAIGTDSRIWFEIDD